MSVIEERERGELPHLTLPPDRKAPEKDQIETRIEQEARRRETVRGRVMSGVDITTVAAGRKGQPRVLLVGDYAPDLYEFMAAQRDYAVDLVLDSGQAARNAGMLKFDVVVTGLKIAPVDGMEVLRAFRGVDPDAPVILSTVSSSTGP